MAPPVKPRTVAWAIVALWLSYGAAFAAAAINFRYPLTLIPANQTANGLSILLVTLIVGELCLAALTYFVASGQAWARLIYTVLLALRTAVAILNLSHWRHLDDPVTLMGAVSLVCAYVAMYWLFTDPGRSWFKR